ncbi:hypothetical protein G7066_11415 [Leucobacter coleopterorum]|uniref:Solute-binding protein family 5 domain-containing protein n=1 Tax=Leucobacter coleopterorum TaxID=2714933 RepID=A0ABX6JZL8_9MICO|nr:ABC transporter substrate-binding protein [Leucobacter coleopterorum]QIM19028.1 hypothetical protein G7066_11415 [Leucobacter coleopterorum]
MLKVTLTKTGSARLRGFSRATLAIIGASALALSSTVAATAATAADSSQARIALIGDIDSLNPFINVLSVGDDLLKYNYEPLVAWAAEDYAESPAIAESWEVNEPGTEWTFHLEPGAKWSDGEPIVADDVIWTIKAIQDNDSLKTSKGL